MKKSIYTLLHLGFWLGYLVLVLIVFFLGTQGEEFEAGDGRYYFSFVTGGAIVPAVISFYACFYHLFNHYLQKQKVLQAVIGGLLIALGAVTIGVIFVALTSSVALGCIQQGLPYALSFMFAIALVFGIIALVIKGFITWFDELKLKEELVEKNHQMELALVKAQLDPHFLFNTINNIDVLIAKDPELASNYLIKLSDMMRFMLYETKAETIPLAQELAYIEKYVQLQQIRTANSNYVNYQVEGTPANRNVAPMIFIPFIENAFKHTGNKKTKEAVTIKIQIEKDAILFRCQNKFTAQNAPSNGQNGLGNGLIEKRLKLLYPKKHRLHIDQQGGNYTVELKLLHAAV